MDGPAWIRAAAVTASLAGLRAVDACEGFSPHDAEALTEAMDALTIPGDRAATARSIAHERAVLTAGNRSSDPAVPQSADAIVPVARALASALRTCGAVERADVVRRLDPALLREIARHTDAREPRAHGLIALVALVAAEKRQGLGAADVLALAESMAKGDGTDTPETVRRALRSARIAGLQLRPLRELLREFAQRASAGQT